MFLFPHTWVDIRETHLRNTPYAPSLAILDSRLPMVMRGRELDSSMITHLPQPECFGNQTSKLNQWKKFKLQSSDFLKRESRWLELSSLSLILSLSLFCLSVYIYKNNRYCVRYIQTCIWLYLDNIYINMQIYKIQCIQPLSHVNYMHYYIVWFIKYSILYYYMHWAC